MPSLVLLNKDGTFFQKLQFVSLPRDYVVPEGKLLSWKCTVITMPGAFRFQPLCAYFYFASASATVERSKMMRGQRPQFASYDDTLEIIVQATHAHDLNWIRDRVMHVIQSIGHWDVINDWNPKPKKPGLIKRFWESLDSNP